MKKKRKHQKSQIQPVMKQLFGGQNTQQALLKYNFYEIDILKCIFQIQIW